MPLRNRVTPWGEIIETPARGTLMGNRGCLHNERRELVRDYQGKRWIACALKFKGRRLPLMEGGSNTQLFFLDEATALAAGHRPCMECRRLDFIHFREHWAAANPDLIGPTPIKAADIDAVLHVQRIGPKGKVTFPERLGNLPTGTLVTLEPGQAEAYLVLDGRLLVWTPEGYGAAVHGQAGQWVHVLTPASIVRTLAHGYRPQIHPL